jgi:DNA processing protein
METSQLIKWLKLCTVKGLGPSKILKLFECFHTVDVIWETSSDDLLRSRVFNEKMILYWNQLKEASSENFEKILIECKENNITIMPIISDEFPIQLKFTSSPPVNLFLQGKKELLYLKKVAIVGSRSSDEPSKKWAFKQAMELAQHDIVIVSGGAIGIDYEAHRGALEASGKTICVMGAGLLKPFPEQHIPLFNEIKINGLLISEYPPSFPGSRIGLLQRNRITSGISNALIAATATSGHGVMTQLKHAHEQRIPLFCPKFSFGFSPSEGLKEVKEDYKITEIGDIGPVLEVLKNSNLSVMSPKQVNLF